MFERDPHKLFPHDRVMEHTIIPLVPLFVTPNMVTMLRFVLIPFVLWFLYIGNFEIGVPLFLFAALTDALDGSLARVRNNITQWGSFYDPVADKILVGSVVLLVVVQHLNVVLGLLIILCEAIITLVGIVRKCRGEAVSANIFGKTKMFLQIVGVTMLLIALWLGFDLFMPISSGTLSLAVVFAIISLFAYGL
jgi:CDP-diacylglycerol--glycerol-3-phosphate 3-phosphatidyltransferase